MRSIGLSRLSPSETHQPKDRLRARYRTDTVAGLLPAPPQACESMLDVFAGHPRERRKAHAAPELREHPERLTVRLQRALFAPGGPRLKRKPRISWSSDTGSV